jgi:sortase (surface protein transpeptidase)
LQYDPAMRKARLLAVALYVLSLGLLSLVLALAIGRLLPVDPPAERSVLLAAPVELRIPALGIDAPVTSVGQLPDGSMDIPRSPNEIGWYAPGTIPGDVGSAVLSGHFDAADGSPAVFWKLGELKPGDVVLVATRSGSTLRFRVTGSERYPHDEAPLQRIFAAGDEPRLNLVTCAGEWNRTTYAERLVVYTRLETTTP